MTRAKEPPHIRAARERLGLTPEGLLQLARGVAGRRIGGGNARLKLIADGFAIERGELGMQLAGQFDTVPTDKGRAAIEAMRAAGW